MLAKGYDDPAYNEDYYPDVRVSDMDDHEIEYLALLLAICSIPLDTGIQWLNSPEGVSSLATSNLKPDFFDSIDNTITSAVTTNYPDVSSILENSYTLGRNAGFEILKRPQVTGTADKFTLSYIEQYNFGKIRNLTEEMKNELRDVLSRGVIENKSLETLTEEIKQIGIKPLNGKSNAQARSASIARTELTRSRVAGKLQAFKYYGVGKVNIVEIGDGLECEDCLELIANNPWTLEEIARLIPVHPNCYDESTEVYTNHGFKLIKDINKSDLILSMDPETGLTEFVPFIEKIAHKNTENYLYHIHNKWFDCKITKDHDLFIHKRVQRKGKRIKEPMFLKPYELNSECHIPRTAKNNNISPDKITLGNLELEVQDYVILLAWYLSDGYCEDNRLSISCHEKSTDKRNIMIPFFDNFKEKYDLSGSYQKEKIHINSKDLVNYFKPLGKSHEKYIPNELFILSSSDLDLFLDNYVLCDGHYRVRSNNLVQNTSERIVFTTSERLANDLAYIILLAGYCPSFSITNSKGKEIEFKNGIYTINNDLYNIRINKSEYTTISSSKIEKIHYEGMVYCLALPKYHTLWIRSNGKTSWNSNCRHDELEPFEEPTENPLMEVSPIDVTVNISVI